MMRMRELGVGSRIGIVLAALLLVACSSPSASPTGSAPPSAASPSAASPSATSLPTPGVTPSPAPTQPFSTWSRADLPNPRPDVYGGAYPKGVVQFRGAYFAVGGVYAGCCTGGFSPDTRALVWRGSASAPTAEWELLADRPEFALGHMNAIATNGERLVAVGWVDRESPIGADPTAAFWWSDDGETWTRILSARGALYDVAFTDSGFLAMGLRTHDPADGICEWGSRDGIRWDSYGARVGQCNAGNFMHSVRPMPNGKIIFGSNDEGAVIWTNVVIEDVVGGSRSDDPSLSGGIVRDVTGTLLGDDPHLVAVGSDAKGRPTVWLSTNGRSWTPVHADAFASGQLERLVTLPDGTYLAVGESDAGGGSPGARLWSSADGRVWTLVDGPGAMGIGAEVFDAIATADGGVMIVGSHSEVGGFGMPLVLIGQP
jgi:hypothetical protein